MMTEIQAMSAELITRLKMKQIAESSNGIMIKSVEKAGNYMWLFETDAGYFLQCIDESYSAMSPIYKNKEDITPELIKRMDQAFEEGHVYGYN